MHVLGAPGGGLVMAVALFAAMQTTARVARAHPLGNFSIDHYSRLRVTSDAVELRYLIDMAEIPTFQETPLIDANRDGEISPAERRDYLAQKAVELAAGLTLTVDGIALRWRIDRTHLTGPAVMPPPAGTGLPTMRLLVALRAPRRFAGSGASTAVYADGNFPGRVGWKEIVIEPGPGIRLVASSAPLGAIDVDPAPTPPALAVPPQDVTAHFTVVLDDDSHDAGIFGGRTSRHVWLLLPAATVLLVFLIRKRDRWIGGRRG
jgi:hypothetical protein